MKTIIGGLLVVSLLSRPSVMNFAYVAYDILNKENRIVCVLKESDDNAITEKTEEIDGMLASIEENTRDLTSLLKEKNKVMGKLETAMDLRSFAKVSLDEKQMDSFAKFIAYFQNEKTTLHQSLQEIEANKHFNKTKKELLHTDVDYQLVYDELKTLNQYQNEAIGTLNSIITEGRDVLNLL